MFTFRNGAGAVVAADSKNTVAAMDDALLNSVRMCASIIEATQGSNLPAMQSQKLLSTMAAGFSSVVSGRANIVATIRQLAAIKGQSNFAPEDFGCPGGLDCDVDGARAGACAGRVVISSATPALTERARRDRSR